MSLAHDHHPTRNEPSINTIDYWASLNLQTQGRKRLAFTIKQKMKIIQEIERGKSKSDVARELGLASSTVATIWKNRESIAESWRNRDMMQQHTDREEETKKSTSSNLVSVTSLVTNTVLSTTSTTNSNNSTGLPAVVVTPPQVQVVPPLPPPPAPLSLTTTTSTTLVPSSQPTLPSTTISSTSSTGTTTTTTAAANNLSMDNTQQAQTQTQSQELLEVRCRMTASLSTSSPYDSTHPEPFRCFLDFLSLCRIARVLLFFGGYTVIVVGRMLTEECFIDEIELRM